jgi:NTE family protein
MAKPRTVSLVLGAGGARGLAHIGVIRYLEEHDYQIRYIAGSSMGALVGEHRIEDLPPIGCTAVATCLNDQREVWFNRGSLFKAIRASIAIPGIFAPVRDGDRILGDGGLVNPVPIAPGS